MKGITPTPTPRTPPIAIDPDQALFKTYPYKLGIPRPAYGVSLPSPPPSLPALSLPKGMPDGRMDMIMDSAIDDEATGDNGTSGTEADEKRLDNVRARRASDGQPLAKEGGRKFNRPELHCEKCGKGYKHSSCLAKHLLVSTSPFPITTRSPQWRGGSAGGGNPGPAQVLSPGCMRKVSG